MVGQTAQHPCAQGAEVEADLLVGLAYGGVFVRAVAWVDAAAGQGGVTRPAVAGAFGAANHQEFQVVVALAEHAGHGGAPAHGLRVDPRGRACLKRFGDPMEGERGGVGARRGAVSRDFQRVHSPEGVARPSPQSCQVYGKVVARRSVSVGGQGRNGCGVGVA